MIKSSRTGFARAVGSPAKWFAMDIGVQKILLAAALLLGAISAAAADGHAARRHHHGHAALPVARAPESFGGGRLVMNPSFNIACQTRDRATRALPCDQPVWVYGSPCEIDLGLGRWRDCDDPPGVVRGGSHRRTW